MIMYKIVATLALALLAGGTLSGCAGTSTSTASQAPVQVKAVYHINTDVNTVPAVLNNIRNHMNADPKAKIVVVTHGPGINFLLQDAKDAKGNEFSGTVSDLASKGIEFRVCNNTLTARNINPDRLLMETKIVPSGVAEVARLQAEEGYVYLKP
jgi:intracellular sulfur oxidation DsrE/DsrF family protein